MLKLNEIYQKGKEINKMEPKDYIVTEISGEYATLTDRNTDETLFIALALLPLGTDIGTKLHYEMLEYTIED